MPDEDIKMDFIEGVSEEEPGDEEKHEDATDGENTSGEDTGDDAGDKKDEDDSHSDDVDAKKSVNKVQKRIDKLTKKMRDQERENIYLRGRLSEIEKAGKRADDAPAQLSRDDFESDEAYLSALNDQNLEILRKEHKKETEKETEVEENKERQAIQEQYDSGRKKYKDFDDVALADTHQVTQEMFDAAKGEHLEDILYVLGKNPEASNRIASLPKSQQIKEIGKVEARIEKVKGKKPKTKIPEDEPIPTLKGGSKPSGVTPKDVSQMSFRERQEHWAAERESKLKKQHGLA